VHRVEDASVGREQEECRDVSRTAMANWRPAA
jgi:hypothetical protein